MALLIFNILVLQNKTKGVKMKKRITVEVVGAVPTSVICDFYNTIFRTIDEKYGRDFLLAVKEELDKQ